MIDETERIGYDVALVNVGYTQILATDYRNSGRCIVDDVEMASLLWDRIKSFVPSKIQAQGKEHEVVGLNERLISPFSVCCARWCRRCEFPRIVRWRRSLMMMMRCVPSPPRRLRFLRYKPGEYFRPHRDGSYCREDHSEFSVATIMVCRYPYM